MLASSRLIGLASTEMIQEFVHHRLRQTLDRTRCVSDARNLTELVRVVPFDHTVLTSALDLIERTGIRGRDAVHVATALTQGVTHIISTDSDFDNIPGLTRLDPMNAA
jgi:predicted nucleic acid-binding protein